MRVRTNRFRNLVATYWQPAVFYGMLIIFFGLLLWFELAKLPGGYSNNELAALQASKGLRQIWESPINAPFSLIAYLFNLVHVGEQIQLPLRAASTVVGLLTLTTFYWLVRHWHGERSAILGTIVFGCSAWFLHTSRLGVPEVMMFLALALVACFVWLKQTDNPLVLLVGFGLTAILLYVPGMIWLLLIAAIWQFKNIVRLFKHHTPLMVTGSLGLLLAVAPLFWSMYGSIRTIKIFAGLPADGWPQAIESLKHLASIPYNLFVRGPLDAEVWLGRLPVLDTFSIVMFLLGAYLYVRHWRLARSKMVAVVLVAGSLLIGLGGAVGLSILIPFVYLLVAAGMGVLMDRWQKVFPRNIIAQSVSVGLVSIAVIAASWYGLRHYFVAWPNAPVTKQVFVNGK